MKNALKFLSFTALLLTGAPAGAQVPGQPAPPPTAPAAAPLPTAPEAATAPTGLRLPPDRTAPLARRRYDADRLDELASEREFRYVEEKITAQTSPWAAFWQRLLQRLFSWSSQPSYSGFWRWIIYAGLVAAGVFVVLRLLQVDFTVLFGRKPRPVALAYDTEAENIHEVNFTDRLAEAETAGNLRLAVRLGYLALLKQLTDRDLIQWKPDKTNHAYLHELPETGPLRADFREIVRQFEYVWYGEWPLGPAQYQRVRDGHHAFAQQVAATRLAATR